MPEFDVAFIVFIVIVLYLRSINTRHIQHDSLCFPIQCQ